MAQGCRSQLLLEGRTMTLGWLIIGISVVIALVSVLFADWIDE